MSLVEAKKSVDEWRRLLVEDNTVTLSDFMESRRNGLFSEFPDEREEALTEIVDVVRLLSNDFLSQDQVGLLLEFFIGRLETSALAGGAVICGIHHLILHAQNLPPDFEYTLIRFLFKEGNVQSWGQKERRLQYDIIDWLLRHRLSLLQALGLDFVATFVKCVSGERDPRCLLVVFNMFLKVANNFDLGVLAEEMFETVACYFPVDFNPTASDKITRNELSMTCATCLVASPSFASFCYLLIDEKFNDDECSDEQKEEVCSLLKMACQRFPSSSIAVHVNELLGGLRMVALNPKNRGEMSSHVTPALSAMITAVRGIPQPSISDETKLIESLVDNLEPFVLQAEMGLCGKALQILKVAYEKSSREAAEKILAQSLAWIVTLVQGDSVNAAGNKVDIVTEGLQYLTEWTKDSLTREDIGVTTLSSYESNIFASIDVAREFTPKCALIALCECAKVYFDAQIASELLVDRCRSLVAAELKTVTDKDFLKSFERMISAMSAKHVAQLQIVFEDNAIDSWNEEKVLPVLCATVTNEDSWQIAKSRLDEQLRYRLATTSEIDLSSFEQMCTRCAEYEELLLQLIRFFISIMEHTSSKGKETDEKMGASLQKVCLLLENENHKTLLNELYEKLEQGSNETSRRFELVMLQTENSDYLTRLAKSEKLEQNTRRRFLFAAVNRGAIEVLDLSENEDAYDSFIEVKALLLSNAKSALDLFAKLLRNVASKQESSPELDQKFIFLLDFDRFDADPERCRYQTGSPMWRHRMFFRMVPIFTKIFEEVGEDNEGKLIGLLPVILEFAQSLGALQIQNEFANLLPLLLASLGHQSKDGISTTILSAVPTFLNIADSLKTADLIVVVNRLCGIIRNSNINMKPLLDALDSLSTLARRQPPKSLHPFVTLVVTTSNRLLDHKKRVVRQKTAHVKNQWEMLTTK